MATRDGVVFPFPHSGQVVGTDVSDRHRRDDDWSEKGSNPSLRDRWYAILDGHNQYNVKLDLDVGLLIWDIILYVAGAVSAPGVAMLIISGSPHSRSSEYGDSGDDD